MSQPKFSIPILHTLITNFYPPAPIIIPPGSDPNPNPQVIDHSSRPVPMDVDPCVAPLRSEVVFEKVDLTVSEHAGVAMSQHTTKVSTTSTVIAPQALTKNNDFTTCDTAKAYMKHLEATTDLKTTRKLTGSSPISRETPSPVATDMLNQKPEKKKNHELDNNNTQKVTVSTVIEQETSVVANDTFNQQEETPELFVCAIPPPGQYYKKIAMLEVDESLFKIPVPAKPGVQKKLKISKQTSIPMEESNSVEIEKNTVWCEKSDKIPNLPLTASENPKLSRGGVVNSNESKLVRCELCGISCNARDVLEKHIAGKKHQKNLKKTDVEGKVVILEGSKRKTDDSLLSDVDADTKRQKIGEEEGVGGLFVTCKVCNVGCYGFTAYNTHLAGLEHRAMVLKHGKGGSMGKI